MRMEYTVVQSHLNPNRFDTSETDGFKTFNTAKKAKEYLNDVEKCYPQYKNNLKVICRQVTGWYDYDPPWESNPLTKGDS